MIVFLDESYDESKGACLRHVYAGFGISENAYRTLMAVTHQCKLFYFIQDLGMTNEQRAQMRQTRIITAEPPDVAEIKGAKLLTLNAAVRHRRFGDAPGLLMAEDLLKQMIEHHAIVFAVMSEPDCVADIQGSATQLPLQFARLLERIEQWMEETNPEGAAIIVPDTVHDRIDRHLSRHIADFLFRSNAGKKMRHIVPNPFWVDSQATTGSQLADLVAHILLNNMRPRGERKPLHSVSDLVSQMEYISGTSDMRGIRRIKRKQQA